MRKRKSRVTPSKAKGFCQDTRGGESATHYRDPNTAAKTEACVQEMDSGKFGNKSPVCLSFLPPVVWPSSYHPPNGLAPWQVD